MLARRAALLIETSREYGRGLLRGIIRYQHEHQPWSLYFKPQGLGAPPPPWLGAWRGDGISARIDDRRMADAVLRTKAPAIDLRAKTRAVVGCGAAAACHLAPRAAQTVAVMTCHNDRGQQVLDACLRADLAVPDEVAILGVDNDSFLCNLSTPKLSSIDVNAERIGYEAAALLDRMMKGGRAPRRPLLFAPRGLVIRQSTDVTAVSDAHVVHAARLIRDHAHAPVGIEQLLKQVPVSRSALFRRFKEVRVPGRDPRKTRKNTKRASVFRVFSWTQRDLFHSH